jgi:ATP-dependent RNA helicase DeaD
MTETSTTPPLTFRDLGLLKPVFSAVEALGYEVPTPIQAQTIPALLEGRDLLGQAQTGTGKTAAFALPILSTLDLARLVPQVLVLTPTRELSIQVAEAFKRYASQLENFHVAPIYGGQDMFGQLKKLKRGLHVVVGTPGRVMDHLRRKTLKLANIRCVVLDEADEMLHMGFIEDVEWILGQVPDTSQVALFSATLPAPIRRIAKQHLENPVEITIEHKTGESSSIRQRYWMVSGLHKLDALTRILEVEKFEAILIFVRTKTLTVELAVQLEARGFAAAALNGDIPQSKREETVGRFRSGKLDILVATDVAARGLDIDRISHVINYDIPHNAEAYIHRIGRTGRAGRSGEAILFVSPRERGLLNVISKVSKRKIEMMNLPTPETVNDVRVERFKQSITETLAKNGLEPFRDILEAYRQEHDTPALDIAAALARMIHAEKPILVQDHPRPSRSAHREAAVPRDHPIPVREGHARGERRRAEHLRTDRARTEKPREPAKAVRPAHPRAAESGPTAAAPIEKHRAAREREAPPAREFGDAGDERPIRMVHYRMQVGRRDKVNPGAIAAIISREAGLDRKHIGNIQINDETSVVELPDGMPSDVYKALKKVRIMGKPMNLTFEPSASRQGKRPRKG